MAEKTVGQVLRAKRAKLDMTLNQVEEFTKIQKTYIIALEQDDYAALPGEFYIKAYLKQYAERLDLDPDQLVDAYEKGRMIEVSEPTDSSEHYRFVKPSERVDEEQELAVQKNWQHYLPITILGAVAVLIVIAISTVVFLNKPQNNGIADNLYLVSVTDKTSAKSTEQPDKPVTPESSSSSVAPPPKEEVTVTAEGQALVATVKNAADPAKISLSVVGTTSIWVGMTNSDLPEGQVTLSATTPVTTTLSTKQTVLTVGKTAGLAIKIGDTAIDLSGIAAQNMPGTITITIE